MIHEAIQTLLDERARYERWLAKLHNIRSDFRPMISERVRLDYEERLRAVESTLSARTAELETSLADSLDGLEVLAIQHDARSADLDEVQLRHLVGEYTCAEWERKRARYRSLLKGLNTQLADTREFVQELKGLLSKLSGQSDAFPALQARPDSDEVATRDEEPAARDTVPVVTRSMAWRNPGDDIYLAELEFLDSVSGEDSPDGEPTE